MTTHSSKAFAPEPAKGSIITDNGNGFPITRGSGDLWFRTGWPKGKTWAEVMAWHQEAIDDTDDDTDEPFAPVLMVPAARSLHLAATREALASTVRRHWYRDRSSSREAHCACGQWVESVQRHPHTTWDQHVIDAILAPGGPIQLVSDVQAAQREVDALIAEDFKNWRGMPSVFYGASDANVIAHVIRSTDPTGSTKL